MKKIVLILCLILTACHKQEADVKIHQLTNQSHTQMESYVITTKDGLCFVFDGGTDEDAPYLIEYIKEHDDNATVDGWFITHYHQDHSSALASYLESGNQEIQINQIYHDLPEDEIVQKYNPNRYEEFKRIENAIENSHLATRVFEGFEVAYEGIKIQVINDVQAFENNFGNNTSIVYKVSTPESDLLILGDTGEELANYLIENKYDQIKNMDYVQMAHHGQRGASKELYHVICPKVCLWPITDWIYTNNNGTTDLRFDETQEWLKDIDHQDYFAKDGTLVIEMK